MKIPKTILTALQSLGTPKLVVLALVVAVAIIGGLYLLWRSKNKKKNEDVEGAAADAADVPAEKTQELGKNALRDVWRSFLEEQRPEYRHVLPAFQPVVFLGNHTIASRELISAYTIWEMLRQQGRNSETKDTNLHLYVDAMSVVQDVQPHLTVDGSERTLEALERLWRDTHAKSEGTTLDRIFHRDKKKHAPLVIVGLDWSELQHGSDKATTWAQQARGKIDRLSQVTGSLSEVRVALTGLSGHPHYKKFLDFSAQQHIELVLSPAEFDRDSLRKAFADLAGYSALALTEMSADDYRKAMDFVEEIPDQLDKLSAFMAVLLRTDSLSVTPHCGGIYFCNEVGPQGGQTGSQQAAAEPATMRRGANPFQVDASTIEEPKRGPNYWHKVAAAAIAALAIVLIVAWWAHERSLWLAADSAAANYELTETSVVEQEGTEGEHWYQEFTEKSDDFDRRQVVDAFVEQAGRRAFFPGFYDGAIPTVQDRFAQRVRTTAFEGLISQSISGDELAHQRVLYLLALIHACQGNDEVPANGLAAYAIHRTDTWSSELELPQELLDQYLRWSRTGQREAVPLTHLDDGRDSGEKFKLKWTEYFQALADVTEQQGAFDTGSLGRLEEESRNLKKLLTQTNRFSDALKIIEELKYSRPCSGADTGVEEGQGNERAAVAGGATDDLTYKPLSPWWPAYRDKFAAIQPIMEFQSELRDKQGHLRQVLQLVKDTSLDPPFADEARKQETVGTLASLLHGIQEIEDGELLPKEVPQLVSAAGQWYNFDVAGWTAAVRYNGQRQAINQFLNATDTADPVAIFFGAVDKRDLGRCHVMLNAGARGEDFFTGKVDIPCEYTRDGFEKYVLPQLTKLVKLQHVGRVDSKVYQDAYKLLYERLDAHLKRAITRYTTSYRRYWLSYFERFGMRATSVEQLLILLRRLESATSPLQEVMDTLLRNIQITSPDTLHVYVDPLQKALNEEFQPLLNVKMSDYLAFVTALRETLEAQQPVEEKGGDEAATASVLESSDTLDAALRPEGRVALATLLGEAGSQNTLIRKWLRETNIARYTNPFDDPFNDINRLGISNLRSTLKTAWRTSFEAEVAPVFQKFPFNTGASQEALPDELNRLFTPETGLFFSLVQRYVLPVSRKDANRGYGPQNATIARAKLIPDKVYATINNVEKLSKTLWDEKGTPRNYAIPFYGEPMPVGNRTRSVLTLAYLREGDRSLVNFNQAKIAVRKVLEIDWATPSAAQVGLRLTDVETKEDTYPRGLASEKKYWSLLHLLQRRYKLTAAEVAKLPRLPRGHKRYAFRFVLGSAQGGGSLTVSFVAEHDPFSVFRRLAYSGSVWR